MFEYDSVDENEIQTVDVVFYYVITALAVHGIIALIPTAPSQDVGHLLITNFASVFVIHALALAGCIGVISRRNRQVNAGQHNVQHLQKLHNIAASLTALGIALANPLIGWACLLIMFSSAGLLVPIAIAIPPLCAGLIYFGLTEIGRRISRNVKC